MEMEAILSSNTSSYPSHVTINVMPVKIPSAPVAPITSAVEIKPQLSAPSYFYSLTENETPPFIKPNVEPTPKVVIGSILHEDEVIAMIAAHEADKEHGINKYLGWILRKKNIIRNDALTERNFLISLLTETIDYAAQRDFDAFKLSVLLTIYLKTHCYFKWYYWQAPVAVWNYFKELMIKHTIENSPKGQEVFGPEECYDIVSHFHTVYLSNLPLIHIVTFGSYKLKFLWPFQKK